MIPNYYEEGKSLYHGGVTTLPENPYDENSAPGKSWEAGWTDAWYDDTIGKGNN